MHGLLLMTRERERELTCANPYPLLGPVKIGNEIGWDMDGLACPVCVMMMMMLAQARRNRGDGRDLVYGIGSKNG